MGTACNKLGDTDQASLYLDRFKELKARDKQAHRDRLKVLGGDIEVREGVAEILVAAGRVFIAHGDTSQGEAVLTRANRNAKAMVEPIRVGFEKLTAQVGIPTFSTANEASNAGASGSSPDVSKALVHCSYFLDGSNDDDDVEGIARLLARHIGLMGLYLT